MSNIEPPDMSNFLFYSAEDGSVKVQVMFKNDTVWATQKSMAEIFDVEIPAISKHINNIYAENELIKSTTISKMEIVQQEGQRRVKRQLEFYNLDMLIAVGYRVNSLKATQFRIWATEILREYLVKGFVLDDERLKQGSQIFGKDYFDELLERIREIRASERRFYQKITDLFAQASIDYDAQSIITRNFYASVQNKFHFAIHGHTASELIAMRADSSKPYMGLTSWKGEGKGRKILKSDVSIAKNYLTEQEISNLNLLVDQYLSFAEGMARRQKVMKMEDWVSKLDDFLHFNEYNVLSKIGNISAIEAKQIAEKEYEKFRVIQDREFKSDFDKLVLKVKERKYCKSDD